MNKTTTALVVIDLQKGIAAQPTQPHPSQEVIRNAAHLVTVFRKHMMPVFLVHVVSTPETMLKIKSDTTFSRAGPMPPDWSEFIPEIAPVATDVVIGKKQWGAFYGTDLELQLRRRGMDTIVLCGIATDFGVESTARFAYEYRVSAGLCRGCDGIDVGGAAPCRNKFHLQKDGQGPDNQRDPCRHRIRNSAPAFRCLRAPFMSGR